MKQTTKDVLLFVGVTLAIAGPLLATLAPMAYRHIAAHMADPEYRTVVVTDVQRLPRHKNDYKQTWAVSTLSGEVIEVVEYTDRKPGIRKGFKHRVTYHAGDWYDWVELEHVNLRQYDELQREADARYAELQRMQEGW